MLRRSLICVKQVYQEVGIPEGYYLLIAIFFSVFPRDLYLISYHEFKNKNLIGI